MRCKICDCILTDTEAVAKDETGEYLDTCDLCLYDLNDPWLEGPETDLLEPDDYSIDDDISK